MVQFLTSRQKLVFRHLANRRDTPVMDAKAAFGAEGWFQTEPEPALIGHRCQKCSTIAFPRPALGCPNPSCDGADLDAIPMSRMGTVWSYTDAGYQPPPPFVPTKDPYKPFSIVAVELPAEKIIVLGQLSDGFSIDDVAIGDEVELTIAPLFSDAEGDHLIWKWRPVEPAKGVNS